MVLPSKFKRIFRFPARKASEAEVGFLEKLLGRGPKEGEEKKPQPA